MLTSPIDIANQLRNLLPADKKDASWGYLAEQFPWYPMVHLLRASEHMNDAELLQKAGLYHPDLLRLNVWLQQKESHTNGQESPAPIMAAEHPNEVPDSEIPAPQSEEPSLEVNQEPELIKEETEATAPETIPTLALAPAEPDPLEDLIPITPYHTVDYFASQGIKVEKHIDTNNPTQLDKQVKSFTDWLKTMKKLKYQPATAYTDPLVEVKARASIHKKEVVTEAMAEVWAKQGDFDQAAQVYAKLMLLHPEKTPYFAARLKDLKENQ